MKLLEKPQVRQHWRRNKRATVDLSESPFVVDRQLEDQRQLMQRNRNPLADVPVLGIDKLRSERHMHARMMKAPTSNVCTKLVSKIVRQESGVNSYVLLNKKGIDKQISMPIDVDTVPFLEPYRKESMVSPVMMSLGHRPSSASRTFHPSSMRVRLHKGEIAASGAAGIGLHAATLASVLRSHATPVYRDDDNDIDVGYDLSKIGTEDFASTAIFGADFDYNINVKPDLGRKWDSSHQVVDMRLPRMTQHTLLPITERLTRFRVMAGSDQTTEEPTMGGRRVESRLTRSKSLANTTEVLNRSSAHGTAYLEAQRRREGLIRQRKLEDARSLIPRVSYRPGTFMNQWPGLPHSVLQEEIELREMAATLTAASNLESRSARRSLVRESTEIVARAYTTSKPILRTTNATSLNKTSGSRLEGNQRDLYMQTTRARSGSNSGEILVKRGTRLSSKLIGQRDAGVGALEKQGDRLFDFMMQEEGRAAALAQDEEVIGYLEEKLYRESSRVMEAGTVRQAMRRPMVASSRVQGNGKALEASGPLASLYIYDRFDFGGAARVEPMRREVEATEATLEAYTVQAEPADDLDSLDSGSVVNERDLRDIASDVLRHSVVGDGRIDGDIGENLNETSERLSISPRSIESEDNGEEGDDEEGEEAAADNYDDNDDGKEIIEQEGDGESFDGVDEEDRFALFDRDLEDEDEEDKAVDALTLQNENAGMSTLAATSTLPLMHDGDENGSDYSQKYDEEENDDDDEEDLDDDNDEGREYLDDAF